MITHDSTTHVNEECNSTHLVAFFLSAHIAFLERVRHLAHRLKKHMLQFNLFESKLSWNDHERRQTEIITTRLYLILLSVCVIIASIYTSSIFQTRVFTVKYPSQATFEELHSNQRWSPTLACPCQNLSIPYNHFIRIAPRFHQICSSDFVISNSQWVKLFSQSLFNHNYSYDDFRLFVVPQFRALTSLCTIANETVIEALSVFISNTLISAQAEPIEIVQSQISSAVAQFKLSTTEGFIIMFNHVKDIVKGNSLISSTLSNWYLADMIVSIRNSGEVDILPRSYGNNTCSCDTNSTCSTQASIDEWLIPGFRVGCYAIESLLQSTLECLYDATCISRITPNDPPSSMIFRPLDSALSSPTVTIQSLLDALMIDEWRLNITYDRYYTACAPAYCTYSFIMRFDSVYIFTTIMGLSGGLTVVLKLTVPFAVKIGRYIARYRLRLRGIQPLIT